MKRSSSLRKAAIARDGRCLKCGLTSGLEAHHIDAVVDGGSDEISNLFTLCGGCHREWTDAVEPLGVSFSDWVCIPPIQVLMPQLVRVFRFHDTEGIVALTCVPSLSTRQVIPNATARGKLKKSENGGWNGCPVPFGYSLVAVTDGDGNQKVDNGKTMRRLVRHPDNAPILEEMFARYASGHSLDSISEWLTFSGVKTYYGAAWSRQTVRQIIKNRFYIGEVRSGDGYVSGKHEPLISVELWNKVRALELLRKSIPRRQLTDDNPLSGVLFCSECGQRFGVTDSGLYYRCGGRRNGKCSVRRYSADAINNAAFSLVQSVSGAPIEHQKQAILDFCSTTGLVFVVSRDGTVKLQRRIREGDATLPLGLLSSRRDE